MAKKQNDKEHIAFHFKGNAGESLPEEETIDLFDEESEEPSSDRPVTVVTADKPDGEATASEDSPAEEMARMFDRYGRNISKKRRKKNRYGKRKNVPTAAPRIVMNETIASREQQAAQERSRQRAARREAKERYERELRKREREAQRIRFLKTTAFGLVALGILVFAAWFSTRITEIKVNAVEGYTTDELITKSGVEYGRCIVFQNLDAAKANLESDAYLKADVRYSFPSTVTINIVRRTAAACVRWGPQNKYLAIIDASGIVLNADAESTGGLIVAEGLSITTATEGKMLGETTDLKVNGLVRILSKLYELNLINKSPRLSRIDMSELMSISISTEGANYSIEVGDTSNLDTKFMLLQKHWDEIMTRAAEYIMNGYSTATIYLYSKGGVSISPYEPGYNAAMENVLNYTLPTGGTGTGEATTPPSGTGESTPDPNQSGATATPGPTQMPHQNGAFTG